MLPSHAEIVIIGGGVMGASAAYHLAKRGVKDMVLLERDDFFGQGSTGKCAGGIRHQFSTDVNIHLSLKSIAMMENFEAETGQALSFKQCGYLFLLSTTEEVEQFKRNITKQHALGVMTELWTVAQIAKRVPLLNLDGIIAGTYYGRDGIADPSDVVNGYINAARGLGVRTLAGVAVTGITRSGEQITAVETTQGTIKTNIIVCAAGAWSAQIGAMVDLDIPIQPERQQCLVTTALPDLPPDFPFVIDFHQRLYFHREGAGLLTGLSIVGQSPTFETHVDTLHTFDHLDKAIARLPLLETAGKLSEWAGLYEVTPDAHPIIDAVSAMRGFYLVAGFSGHGFMHGPISGVLIAEQILDGKAHTVDISALAWERFANDKAVREFNVV
jgi:sarcosine oxidase subunit beta